MCTSSCSLLAPFVLSHLVGGKETLQRRSDVQEHQWYSRPHNSCKDISFDRDIVLRKFFASLLLRQRLSRLLLDIQRIVSIWMQYEMAQEFLKPARGETIMDLSCAGGCFTRRFLASDESWLQIIRSPCLDECQGFLKNDKNVDMRKTLLLRADAGRLPLAKASLSAVHAGAAIHCWPQPSIAVSIVDVDMFVLNLIFSLLVRELCSFSSLSRYGQKTSCSSFVEASGLEDWKNGRYILFAAQKPSSIMDSFWGYG